MYGNGPVIWNVKRSKLIPDSTAEAESVTASRGAKDCTFTRGLLKANGRPVSGPTAAIGDNKAVYDMVQQDGASSRTRHFERSTLLYKRAILLLILAPFLVMTDYMIADIFTKATDKATYARMRNVMMNVHSEMGFVIQNALCSVHGSSARVLRRLVDRDV